MPTQDDQTDNPSRTSNAMRYGKLGVIAGAVAGLLSGGGPLAAIQSAAMFGAVSAAGGAVAGNKVNPLLNKILSFIPGLGGGKGKEGVEADTPQKTQQQGKSAARSASAAPAVAAGQEFAPDYESPQAVASAAQASADYDKQNPYAPLGGVDSAVLDAARKSASQTVESAAAAAASNEEAVMPTGGEKNWERDVNARPTHPGSPSIQ